MTEYKTLGQYTPPNLIAGDFPIVTQAVTIAAGQTLSAGAVLGRIQANGRYVLSTATANDGSEAPMVVLAQPINTTNGEEEAVCYLSGQFNTKAVLLGAGHTTESVSHPLRILNIYLTNTL